jgi:SM-20-related protein
LIGKINRELAKMDEICYAVAGRIVSSLTNEALSSSMPHEASARFSLFEEFLSPDEYRALLDFAITHEGAFSVGKVQSEDGGRTDYEHRRSRVLFNVCPFDSIVAERLRHFFPRIIGSLGMEPFQITQIEPQLTASNDGDYYDLHSDDSLPSVSRRTITYVLFVFGEPQKFSGGILRLYNTRRYGNQWTPYGTCIEIKPRPNMMVFFPSFLLHEIVPVHCPTHAFRDSRFTLNGWIHR